MEIKGKEREMKGHGKERKEIGKGKEREMKGHVKEREGK